VLAYRAKDRLLHAHKAVEEARWALQRYGDPGIGEKVLARAKEALEFVQKAPSVINGIGSSEEDAEDEVTINTRGMTSTLLIPDRRLIKKPIIRVSLSSLLVPKKMGLGD
jgi:hypothetical protein